MPVNHSVNVTNSRQFGPNNFAATIRRGFFTGSDSSPPTIRRRIYSAVWAPILTTDRYISHYLPYLPGIPCLLSQCEDKVY